MNYYFFFFAVCSLFCPSQVLATTIEPVAHTSSVEPGEQTTIDLTVKNTESSDITITSYVLGVVHDDATGVPQYTLESPLVGWVDTPEVTQLAPGESKLQSFHIEIPSTQTPGAYRGVLVTQVSGQSGQITTEAELGSLITLYVAGDITESLSIRHVDVLPYALRDNKRSILLEFENEGNIHVDVAGQVTIVGRDSKVLDTIPIPIDTIFSQMRRQSQIEIAIPASYVGPFEVQVHATYGLTQKQVGATTSMWYIPLYAWWMLYSILGVIGVGILYLLFRKKRVV